MGSVGTGSFTDFPGSGSPGKGGKDVCNVNEDSIDLEDVGRSAHYSTVGNVPATGDPVDLLTQLSGGRLAVTHAPTGHIIGYLPTNFNFLHNCLQQGRKYSGEVVYSANTPTPCVEISLENA